MKLLIAYGTTDGMTARIAERMGQTARAAGHAVVVARTSRLPDNLDLFAFDAVLVGASLHAGGFQRSTRRFVRRHLGPLHRLRSGFFSVCLAIASKNVEEQQAAWRIARAFPARLRWVPDAIDVFGGALMFSRYGLLRRTAMIHIARKELGDVDVTRDHVYTDWDQVDRFVLGFMDRVAHPSAPRDGVNSPPP